VKLMLKMHQKTVWRSGSARTRWGSLSATPDPLAAIWGLLLRGRKRKGARGKGEPPTTLSGYATEGRD